MQYAIHTNTHIFTHVIRIGDLFRRTIDRQAQIEKTYLFLCTS